MLVMFFDKAMAILGMSGKIPVQSDWLMIREIVGVIMGEICCSSEGGNILVATTRFWF